MPGRNDDAANEDGEVVFSATLRPYRSLGRRGFGVVLGVFAAAWFLTGLYLYALGAWPIVGFFGLDFVLLALAFHLNFRAARAYEDVVVSRDLLLVRKVSPRGRATELRFNPYWVRLEVYEQEDEGVTRILLRERGAAVPVGSFLNPQDRTSFAGAFRAALYRARAA